jgi:methyl-accepting chemotaxis protein
LLLLSVVIAILLTAQALIKDRKLLTAASDLAVGVALRETRSPMGIIEHQRHKAEAAVASISRNSRALIAFNREAVADLATQVVDDWQALSRATVVDAPSVDAQSSQTLAPALDLDGLHDQFSELFSAITTQSLSADVIADVSEVGSDLNLLLSLNRLIARQQFVGLDNDLVAAHEKLMASVARLDARTASDGVLRGYRMRQMVAGFVSRLEAIELARQAVTASRPAAGVPAATGGVVADAFGALERYRTALRSALARYTQILLGLLVVACAGGLALSIFGLRRWRSHRDRWSAIAASGVEADELKQSWVEQAHAIASGDCTFRWRATDDSNRDIATALNSTTDTICGLVRQQKSAAIELNERCSALQSSNAMLQENLQARQTSVAQLLDCLAILDTINSSTAQWVGRISDVSTNIREQADQLSGSINHSHRPDKALDHEQMLARLNAAEQVLEAAVDRIVGVRQITDQSKLLTLNVSLQMVTDGADEDTSAELAERVHQQTERVESEVTHIERSVRSASDELHASLAKLQQDIDQRPQALESDTVLQGLMDSLAHGVTGLSEVAADIYEGSSQRAEISDTIKSITQSLRALDDSDQSLVGDSSANIQRMAELGDEMRDAVAHYVIPVSGR